MAQSDMKAQMQKAKTLIQAKRYAEAKKLLKTINHPTARKWLEQLEVREMEFPAEVELPGKRKAAPARVAVPGEGSYHLFRIVWGILFLISVAWICYGIVATSTAVNQVSKQSADDATQVGAALGGGISLVVFLCTGGLPALIFGILYWRNGVGLRHAREHQELLDAQRR